MGNFYQDNEDLQFYVERGIDWEPLVRLVEHDYKSPDGFKSTTDALDAYRDILNMVGEFVADEVQPRVTRIDRDEATLQHGEVVGDHAMLEVFEGINALELHRLCLPREIGGMGCPILIYMINAELLARADVSVMTHHSFHGGIACALLLFSVREGSTTFDAETGAITSTRFDAEIQDMICGNAWGSMDITEPNAGSDMGALIAQGVLDENGTWRITGQKIFITSGHGKYHIVVARTEPVSENDAPGAGLEGLSLFLVQAYHEVDGKRVRTVTVDRLEEKLGHHGSATCAVTFDRSPAHLIGKRGDGFRNMLLLMNNARIAVGFEALGVCEAALRMARAYAADRKSMGKTIDRHEIIADYFDEMEVDILGIRALTMHGCYNEELNQRVRVRLAVGGDSAAETKRLKRLLRTTGTESRRITPLIKFLAAEKAVEMARRCLQIHGGSGYTMDYGAEKLLRDALVTPIYEGTTQIQALMTMKDTLANVMADPKRFVKQLAQARWRSVSARDPLERRVARLQSLGLATQQVLLSKTAAKKLKALSGVPISAWPQSIFKKWDPKRDFSFALLHAERLTRLLTDVAIAETLYTQVCQFPERRHILERYLERCEPRCRFLHDEISTTGDRLVNELAEPTTRQERERVSA